MTALLDEISADHANMVRLLALLEDQLVIFDRGDDPDYALMAAVVDYCLAYPERYHHPKEDALVEAMREQAPADAEGLDVLLREHEQLAELTQRLAEITEQVLQDLEMPRDLLGRTTREFIDAYRRHIAWEDASILPRVRAALSAEQLRQIEVRLQSAADPLFGGKGEERFRILRQELLEGG